MAIEIWQPRWHDRKVLIAKYKVTQGKNKIIFTKAKQLKDKVFLVDGGVIAKCPIETNGTVDCYAVPLDTVLDGQES